MISFQIRKESWPLKAPFTTARHYHEEIRTLHVTLFDGEASGQGEAVGVDNLGEDVDSIASQAETYLSQGAVKHAQLMHDLPAGGARNAIDCALWDLRCKSTKKSIWEWLGMTPKPITTVYTIPLESVQSMAVKAAAAKAYPHLKIKLDKKQPIEKMEAIRKARPEATLIVDCNQGWTFNLLQKCAPKLASLGVEMIEQPLKVGEDDMLTSYRSPLPLCADESCNTSADLPYLAPRYQMVNIKLDKTGGLTEALNLAKEATALGLELMVGNMLGSSLGMAPAFVIAQYCKYVDLDGPLLQKEDRDHPLKYDGSQIAIPEAHLWG